MRFGAIVHPLLSFSGDFRQMFSTPPHAHPLLPDPQSAMPVLLDTQPNGVATITLNRPERRNALDQAGMEMLAEVIRQLHASQMVRAVILTGAGSQSFCSGGDLNDLHAHLAESDARAMGILMGDALDRLEHLPMPTIAAVNGYALGGGTELALACDWRVFDMQARFGMVHARRGLIPGWGGGQRLLRRVGYARALDMLLSDHLYAADEAYALGLCERLAPAGAALEVATAWAETILPLDRTTVAAAKAMLQGGQTLPPADAVQHERDLFAQLWAGDAHRRSMAEYAAKRGRSGVGG